eukprot:TRINITY_DN14590_c0_g1_i1.p1 TRINITY_DN14590_c0_g1~~TRINITY_DN14590_c0_g1_i1.p1  ORF type:complete len:572 (+),score=161.93 TRINITY_DN14590_c0_g1_i1:71-1786(+)
MAAAVVVEPMQEDVDKATEATRDLVQQLQPRSADDGLGARLRNPQVVDANVLSCGQAHLSPGFAAQASSPSAMHGAVQAPSPESSPSSLPDRGTSSCSSTTAPVLARAALQPGSNVSFPQITEICERVEAMPAEAGATVSVLAAAMKDRSSMQATLKALTIAHEMTYNPRVVRALRQEIGLLTALTSLQNVRDSGLGAPMDENIRMLATEIARVCVEARSAAHEDPRRRKHNADAASSSRGVGISWDRIEKFAMRGMDKADRFGEKTAVAWQKAGKTLDNMAAKVMQEAERQWSSMAGADGQPPVEGRARQHGGYHAQQHGQQQLQHQRQHGQQQQHRPAGMPQSFVADDAAAAHASQEERRRMRLKAARDEEERQLQWALQASLAEASAQSTAAPEASGSEEERPPDGGSPGDASPSSLAHKDATSMVRDPAAAMAASLASADEAEQDSVQLRRLLRESARLAANLSSQVLEAQDKLARQDRHLEELRDAKAQLGATSPSSQGAVEAASPCTRASRSQEHSERERELRARVAELEAQVAALPAAALEHSPAEVPDEAPPLPPPSEAPPPA